MFWLYFLIIAVIVSLLNDWRIKNNPNEQERINASSVNRDNLKAIVSKSEIVGTVMFNSFNNSGRVILDKDKEELHVFYSVGQNKNKIHNYKYQAIKFSDILSSEVVIDSNTVTSTSRGSQIAGVAVGSLFGGAGAIIGGLSGKTSTTENIKNIDIKLTIDDLNNPVYRINFLDGCDINHQPVKSFKKDSAEYRHAISEVEKWQGMFDVILKNNLSHHRQTK